MSSCRVVDLLGVTELWPTCSSELDQKQVFIPVTGWALSMSPKSSLRGGGGWQMCLLGSVNIGLCVSSDLLYHVYPNEPEMSCGVMAQLRDQSTR